MTGVDDELLLPGAPAWQAWLTEHRTTSRGGPLVLAETGVTDPTSLTCEPARPEALCFGEDRQPGQPARRVRALPLGVAISGAKPPLPGAKRRTGR